MKRIELSFQKNIRDIGGMLTIDGRKIQYSRLIRGGYLGRLTEEDIAILNDLKITDVIDFRSEREFNKRHDYVLDGVIYHNFPCLHEKIKDEHKDNPDGNLLWFVENKDTGYTHMIGTYKELIATELGRSAYVKFFNLLTSKERGTYYFHCSQGKDRAGLAAFLLEVALGVSEKDAIKDYLFSNVAMEIRIAHLLEDEKNKPYFNEEYAESLHEVFIAKIDYLNAAIEEIYKLSPTILDFIKDYLKVDLPKLRKFYLE